MLKQNYLKCYKQCFSKRAEGARSGYKQSTALASVKTLAMAKFSTLKQAYMSIIFAAVYEDVVMQRTAVNDLPKHFFASVLYSHGY